MKPKCPMPDGPSTSSLKGVTKHTGETSGLPPGVQRYGGIIDAARTIRKPRDFSKVCCVFGCQNTLEEHPDKVFHPFPRFHEKSSKWLDLINRADLKGTPRVNESRVCSDHFDSSDMFEGVLKPNAVPHLGLARKRVPIIYAPDPKASGFLPSTPFEIKKEPECDTMEVEIQIEPQSDQNYTSKYPKILIPTNISKTNEPSIRAVPQNKNSHGVRTLEVDPLPQASGSQNESAFKIIKVEHIDPSDPLIATETQNRIRRFYKNASICSIECINIPPNRLGAIKTDAEVQTTKELIKQMNKPLVKQHKAEVRELNAKLRDLDKQMRTEWDKRKFLEHCDDYLEPIIATAVKAHSAFQERSSGNRYSHSFKNLALNLYLSSKQSFKFLQQFFCMPTLTTIKRFPMPIRTGVNQYLIDKFKVKVDEMNEKEKICAVCFDYVGLKKSLYYDVTNDFLCGIQDIDRVLGSEPAQFAALLMVRGLYSKWKQPISFALVAERIENAALQAWILKIIALMVDIGLNVKAFVADMDNGFLDFSAVTPDIPYFMVGERKIYHVFDVPCLLRSARDDLMQLNFHFSSGVAKWAHILKVYEIDKEEELSLMPKITEDHVRPTGEAKEKAQLAVDVLSETVAAVINFQAKTNLVPKKFKGTAEFLATMSRLYDLLTSLKTTSENELKEAYKAKPTQTKFLSDTLEYLQTLQIKDSNGYTLEKMNFVDGLTITIKSLMCLSEDMKAEGIPYILTKKLSKDCVDLYFTKARKLGGTSLTVFNAIRFTRSFQRLFFSSLVSNSKEGCSDVDLKASMAKISDYVKSDNINDAPECNTVKLPLGVNDYQALWPVPTSAFITGYLLKKCVEKQHSSCKVMMQVLSQHYKVETSDDDGKKAVLEKLKEYKPANMKKKNVDTPPDYLVELVERMDDMYNDYYRTMNVEPHGFGSNFYKQVEDIVVDKPCKCFPFKFFKILFIRMKIYHTVKEYNISVNPTPRRRRRRRH